MQIFGLDGNLPISALRAERQKIYLCPECRSPLRIRGGPHRQIHFYHLRNQRSCRLHEKGPIHLHIQKYLHSLLEGSTMEMAYPSIGRIADVAWPSQSLIFEIQCSPISFKEAEERCKHYKSLKLTPVWVLHDRRFNKKLLSPAEKFLRENVCCYFTNMDGEGRGCIYDQFECIQDFRRIFKGRPLTTDLSYPKHILNVDQEKKFPFLIRKRIQLWPKYFKGDLFDRCLGENSTHSFESMLNIEKLKVKNNFIKFTFVKKFYFIFLRFILELVSNN